MAIRVAINGFGRIGRLVFRHAMARKGEIDFVGINDLTDAKTLGHLLKYDSVHGRFQGDIRVEGNDLIVDGDRITISAERKIEDLKWKDVDVVIESTGVFTNRESLQRHINNGARRVVLTAPAKDELDATVVLGVNDDVLTPEMKIVSNASCTTNCLA
ncbi:MAG: type I glyceraldehyde-3-phosphate dehydrogenase, partial [bacterium]|nr:type I glyceraldehyde-3-phosphate dehydrogenase [Candidatus Kapabacteria bacterium]